MEPSRLPSSLTLGLLLLVASGSLSLPHTGRPKEGPFSVAVATDGTYKIMVNGVTWLESAPTFFRGDNSVFSLTDQSLRLNSTVAESGTDKLGAFQTTCFVLIARNHNSSVMQACIKLYPTATDRPLVIFQQRYLNDITGCATDVDSVISGFPSFHVSDSGPELGYHQYAGSMFGGTGMAYGQWRKGRVGLSHGIEGGPVLLFDQTDDVIIMAPFNQFMAASIAHDRTSDVISMGIMGGVQMIPMGYMQEFILFYGSEGINRAMEDWGRLMRDYYDKHDTFRRSDLTLNYLGYWTDGGAYYYYNTEPNKNYEQTILDVYNYSVSMNIPYRYVQYDSYFYPKDSHGGVETWTPMSQLFPDGFQKVYDMTGWPAGAHNRYWSPNTTYAKQNGGDFWFVVEKEKSIPVEERFWDYLFDNSRKWGLTLYEQDWLDNEFRGLNATLSNVVLGRTWLLQMGKAAAENGLTIQYCMSNPRHAMQSLEIPVVTQARVSGDYRAGSDQWKIGRASILADAMGIAPYKDTFWTGQVQPGNTYNLEEPYGNLQAMVATLSTGPVGPSDMIGKTNVSVLMQCCTQGGLILKPSRPARAIDAQIKKLAMPSWKGPDGEVWTTYSTIGQYTFGIVMAVGLSQPFPLTPKQAGFGFFNPNYIFPAIRNRTMMVSMPEPWGDNSPLMLPSNCSKASPCVYFTSPAFTITLGRNTTYQVFLYGERDKYVPMSAQRVRGITAMEGDVQLSLVGEDGEQVLFTALAVSKNHVEPFTFPCHLGGSGTATLSLRRFQCL